MNEEIKFQPKNEKELQFAKKLAEEQKTLEEAQKTLDHIRVIKSGFETIITKFGEDIKNKTWQELKNMEDDLIPKDKQAWGNEEFNAIMGIKDKEKIFKMDQEKISDILDGVNEAEIKLEETINNIKSGAISV